MYKVLVQLGDSEFSKVASRDTLEEAVQLVQALSVYWPRSYLVHDSKGKNVDFTGIPATAHERGAARS